MTESDLVRCPRCTRPNRPGARRCAGCGAALPERPTPPAAHDAAPDPDHGGRPDENPELLYQHASSLMDLADMAAAIPLFQRILAADPTSRAALEQLEAIYRSAERWQELTELLRNAADHADKPGDAVEWLDRAATVTEQLLGDPARAIADRERIRELAPRNGENLDHLERLYQAADQPEQAAALRAARSAERPGP